MADAAPALAHSAPSLRALGRYGGLVALANLAWEVAQLPFYTIWRDGTPGAISSAVLHCTAGDVLIAMTCVAIALLVTDRPRWPAAGAVRVGLVATALGAAYTVFSERLNVSVRGSWAYAPEMPVLPLWAPASSLSCNGSSCRPCASPSRGGWWAPAPGRTRHDDPRPRAEP
jgi:hypothetical protein